MPFSRIKSHMCLLVGCTIALSGWASAEEDGLDWHLATVVPDAHAKLGQVYYVVATKGPHVTFRSNAKNEKFKGTSGELSGYVVAPRGGEAPPAQLAAGRFRLEVTSLDTGNSSMNEHMRAKRWLDSDVFPRIEFTISNVIDVKLASEREGSTTYKAKLVGTMSLVGQENEMTVRARITLKPASKKTRKIAPGDLMTIRSSFKVVLSEFGMGINDPGIEHGRIAAKIGIDVNLTLSTLRPNEDGKTDLAKPKNPPKLQPAG